MPSLGPDWKILVPMPPMATQPADAVGLIDREADPYAAAHRTADDVNTIHSERIKEGVTAP